MADEGTEWKFHVGSNIWSARASRAVGDWVIRAEWRGVSGKAAQPRGPNEVTIRAAKDASIAVKVRGITSGTLRDAEAVVTQLTREFAKRAELEDIGDPVRTVLASASRLPDSPRGDPDSYYRTLLYHFKRLERAGHPEPIKALAEATGAPRNTIKSRLRVARQRDQRPPRLRQPLGRETTWADVPSG